MKRFAFWILLITTALLCTACGEKSAQVFAMDTVMNLTAYGSHAEEALAQAEDKLYQLEALLSRTRSGSEVSQLNEAGGAPTAVSRTVCRLIAAAGEYGRETGWNFDITVAPVVEAWGFTTDTRQVPSAQELETLLTLVDGSLVSTRETAQESSVTLGQGQSIDLGGIAKGYASDCMEAIFRQNGLSSALAYLGGNIYAQGSKPDGDPWRVGVQDPAKPEDGNALAGVLELEDAFAVTSGGYQRYFEENGKRYHHIIDPATGSPAQSDLTSVTVIAPANGQEYTDEETLPGNGTMCDAFSTALFVMGEEKALDFWRTSQRNFELILITTNGRVIATNGISAQFSPNEESGYVYETVS